ncbi:4-demethylwyosine synthase TYW1 [Candidatus Micrarchaeota archaeon]|nr:4-demethylwyosine synthase TYW1 [Candidatus Micrarchaeota archaeon]
MVSFDDETRKEFEKKSYGIVGNHSAVQICSWNKKALRNKGFCYKNRFYGVDTHRCVQMSPSAAWCQQNCIFCWRPMEFMRNIKMKEWDPPQEIIQKTVEQRKRLLSGLGGAHDANRELFKQAFERFPSHWAISLSGEPTLYPALPELVSLLNSNPEVKSTFIVTNGQEPEMFLKLKENNSLPTQLYLSLDAPNKALFQKINVPVYPDGWERLMKTISLFPSLPTRKILRFTLIKDLNDADEHLPSYAEIFERSETDFIEVKAYMFLGYSRKRLKKENMPSHEHIVEFSKKLEKLLPSYHIVDEEPISRIVLLERKEPRIPRRIPAYD